MEIGLEEVGVVFAGIAVISLLVTFVAKWAKRSVRIDSNAIAIADVKRECDQKIEHVRTWAQEEVSRIRQEHVDGLRTVNERVNRQRDRHDKYVEETTEVHKALSAVAAGMQAFDDRFDRFEANVAKQIDTLFGLFNTRGPTGPACSGCSTPAAQREGPHTSPDDAARQRWKAPLQPENWRRWWFAYLAHMATGAIAAAGMLIAPVELHPVASLPFALLTLMVWVRQTVEFIRRNDTPGRDLQHHMMGYLVGLAVGWAYLASHFTEVIP